MAEQARLRDARVLVVGCGGVGGTVATILARSGVGAFTLVDPDVYEPTNTNRQIACFQDTLYRNKAEVMAEVLSRVSPFVRVEARPTAILLEELDEWLARCDLVFPAADDYAYSIHVFRRARALGKPALLVVPAGYWAIVTIFEPGSPPLERLHGVPELGSYEELRELLRTPMSRYAAFFYTFLGGWSREHFTRFVEGEAPVSQICPSVWLASSLGAMEVLKRLTGNAEHVAAPRYWLLSRRGRVSLEHMRRPNAYNALALYRRLAWRLLQSPLAGPQKRLQEQLWSVFRTRGASRRRP